MVRLVKIKKFETFIEAYYIPEDSNEEGYIKMRLADKEILERRLTDHDGVMKSYFVHTKNGLKQIIDEGEIPETRLVMWY